MSLNIILLIMAATGLLGGIVNYLLPSNDHPETKKKIRKVGQCIILGIGATILVPLFLEIAQSRLLNEIKLDDDEKKEVSERSSVDSSLQVGSDYSPQPDMDSTRNDSLARVNSRSNTAATKKTEPSNPLKDYLLYAGYCFLAAAAGLRFINSLMDGVLKDKQLENLQDKNEKERKAKEEAEARRRQEEKERKEAEAREAIAEEERKKLSMQNKVNLIVAEQKTNEEIQPKAGTRSLRQKPVIKDITVPDDPQKGRFGGQRESNNRKLFASVSRSVIPMFYDVVIWLEPTNNEPLTGEVIFYLHDSFYEPVRIIHENEFRGNKAIVEVKAYGAFTVGAVCDDGMTLLEYDLAKDEQFPEEFRER